MDTTAGRSGAHVPLQRPADGGPVGPAGDRRVRADRRVVPAARVQPSPATHAFLPQWKVGETVYPADALRRTL